MTKFIVLLLIVTVFATCAEKDVEPKENSSCSTEATVVDLSGLDGCGYAFELKNGIRIFPVIVFYCGTPPLPDNLPPDPIHGFEFVAGKKVMIDYELTPDYGGVCMAGDYARITCISEVKTESDL